MVELKGACGGVLACSIDWWHVKDLHYNVKCKTKVVCGISFL